MFQTADGSSVVDGSGLGKCGGSTIGPGSLDGTWRRGVSCRMAVRDHTLLVFLARHCLIGVAAGWLLLAALLYLDVAGLGQLMRAEEHWLLTLILAAGGFGITFGSLAMGTAIFLLPKE